MVLRWAAAALRRRLQELEQEAERAVDLELLVAEGESTLLTFGATWEALTVDEQRELLRSLVEYLDVYPGQMEPKLVFAPPATLSLDFQRGRKAGRAQG
jgi:hypothetical protein